MPQAAGRAEQVSGRTWWQGGHGMNPEQALSQRMLAASASFMEAEAGSIKVSCTPPSDFASLRQKDELVAAAAAHPMHDTRK